MRVRRDAGLVVAAIVVAALTLAGCAAQAAGLDARSGAAQGMAPQAPAASISIDPSDATAVNPLTPIVVTATNGTLTSVTVTNPTEDKTVVGGYSADHQKWTTSEVLGYGATYTVAITATGVDGRRSSKTAAVHTLTPRAQAYPSLIPTASQDVGVGQPIVVRFDEPITDEAAAQRALTVTSDPPQTGAWHWFSSTEVHYRPEVYWQPGTTVTVDAKLYGVDLGDGVYGQTDRSMTFKVHDSWVAKADGATEQMQIFHDGALVTTMPISLGSPKYPTHTGPHVISDKQPSIIMDSSTYGVGPGQPGYYREEVKLDERISNDGEFVHSAPWSVGQQGDSNVSHGCINLSPANAQWFYDHFGVGDVVEVTNSGGPPLPIWDTYGDWTVSWSDWTAGSA